MDRAKRIASAFIGVAFAAHCCDPGVAQPPSRFIRQPAKTPAFPSPVSPSPSLPSDVPTTKVSIRPTQAPETANSPSVVKETGALNAPVNATTASESNVARETAKSATLEPNSVALKIDAPMSLRPLLSLTDSPGLEFDSFESLASVTEDDSGKKTTIDFESAGPAEKTQFGPLAASTQPITTKSINLAEPRSNTLQWTSRAGGSRSRPSEGNSNATSAPQINGKIALYSPSFNARSNASTQPPYDVQSATAPRQQSDSTNEMLYRIAARVDAIESKFENKDEPAKEDRIRAGLVSARITNDRRFANDATAQPSVTRIESPQGWQAIGARLSEHVTKCESLLRRGAFCSAREEAETACLLLFRHVDLHDNLFRCEPAVQAANQALREAEDFVVALRSTADGDSLRRLVDAHETPILKNRNLTGMSPLTAAQHYRQFAESQLTEAAQGHPWASELLYTVGRTYQAEADAGSNRVDVLRMKAMAHYRASRITLPSNAIACNQLGYLLLQMDRNEEAREALVAAVTLKPDEASLSNLAEVSRRLGDSQTINWATQSVAAIRSRTSPPSPVPPYVELSQEDLSR